MTPDTERTIIAAANNADLYEAVFTSRQLRFMRQDISFVAADQPPPYYSHLVVLLPGKRAEVESALRELGQQLDRSVGFKDSFGEFDDAERFDTLFEARWLWSEPAQSTINGGEWYTVESEEDLLAWEAAWNTNGSPTDQRMFLRSLLANPAVAFCGRKSGDAVTAGFILNRSAQAVGVSNLFCLKDLAGAFRQARAQAAIFAPHLPMTGYARGTLLDAALESGFEQLGVLAVREMRVGS